MTCDLRRVTERERLLNRTLFVSIDDCCGLTLPEHSVQRKDSGEGQNACAEDADEQNHERIQAPYLPEELVSSHIPPPDTAIGWELLLRHHACLQLS